jgi:hypothetical protein
MVGLFSMQRAKFSGRGDVENLRAHLSSEFFNFKSNVVKQPSVRRRKEEMPTSFQSAKGVMFHQRAWVH